MLLAAHAGNVIALYSRLKRIPYTRTAELRQHPGFVKSEYQSLLNFYDALAKKCKTLLDEETMPTFDNLIGDGP